MKKIVMIAFCLISVKYTFAQDEILWASIGGAFTALVEEDSLWKSSAGVGMTFDAYIFPNAKNRKTSNIGLFLQGMLGAGFSMERPNKDIYAPLFQGGLTLGPHSGAISQIGSPFWAQ
ncbi:MAG: hypothetical protein LBL45_06550 [Treponema sp.]|jgi:hypothetical protein|nr:hypothetical protein [Treponema sp.]